MTTASDRWHLLIPVKDPARAKSRLSVLGARRPDLAMAFARDTVGAALACDVVASVTVVTGDPTVAATMRADGARVVAEGSTPELNQVLVCALRAMPDTDNIAVLLGDLPAITPDALGRALALAGLHEAAFLPDANGSGTTLLTAARRAPLQPRFGPGSAAAHAQTGAVRLGGPGLEAVRSDVDSIADLLEVAHLGLGRHTRSVLADIDLHAVPAVLPGDSTPVLERTGLR